MVLVETKNSPEFRPLLEPGKVDFSYLGVRMEAVDPRIALFQGGEYGDWFKHNLTYPDPAYTRNRETGGIFGGETEKAQMVNILGRFFPEDLRYKAQVFSKTEKTEIKRAIEESIAQGFWVGIVTCHQNGRSHLGKAPYVMGLDNQETAAFFLQDDTGRGIPEKYASLRKKYPHFHMDQANTLAGWFRDENLREVVIFTKPSGHARKQEEHFIAGAYLNGEYLVVEIYLFSYHTRVQDKREGDSIFVVKIPLSESFRKGNIKVSQSAAKKLWRSLIKFNKRDDIGSLKYNAPDKETLERLCLPHGLEALLGNIGDFFRDNREEIVGALGNLLSHSYFCVDFIGRIGPDNSVEYCKAFEAKSLRS